MNRRAGLLQIASRPFFSGTLLWLKGMMALENVGQGQKPYLIKIISAIAVTMSLFHIYTGVFGVFESFFQRSVHVLFALLLVFLMYSPSGRKREGKVSWYDWALIVLVLISVGYVSVEAKSIASRYSYVTPLSDYELFAGIVGVLLLLEATRRTMGLALPIISVVFIGYVFAGPYLPGMLRHQGFSVMWSVDQLFYTSEGIWGIPVGVSATFIVMFIIFAAFLDKSKAGDFFINIALALFGQARGGPAKAAVFASGVMGTISGSAVANVVTTGTFTIPLMKKIGYRPVFAGAVESVASSGGQLMPPIMGAGAFVLAEFTGIPYIKVALAAVIPALLYYMSVGFMVHYEALRINLVGLPKSELPDFKKIFIDGFHFTIPLIVLIYFLVQGASPMKAGIYGIIVTVAVSFVRKYSWMTPDKIISALEAGAKGAVEVAIACATAGIVIGVLTLTGLGMRFNSVILSIAGDNLLLTLFLTMCVSIVLGMGLPTVAAYIIQAALTAPALIQLGVNPLAAHMFIFYFAIISAITPPVALAAYAAAGISGADPMRTGFQACKLGIAAFIVPYMFVYAPTLLAIGTAGSIALTTVTAMIGILALAGASVGYFLRTATAVERIMLLVAALSLIKPGIYTDILGLGLFACVFVMQKFIPLKKAGNSGRDNQAKEV
ncbi:MAG: TRAP transporter permease [Bacillota bacterium]